MRQGMGCTASPVCRIYLKGQHYVLWLREARADQMKRACRRQRQHSVKERAKPQNKKKHVDEIEQQEKRNQRIQNWHAYPHSCILLHCTQAKSSYNKEDGTEGALTLYFFGISQTVKELRKCLWLSKSVCIKKNSMMNLSLNSQVVPEAITIFFFWGVSENMALPWLVGAIYTLLEGLQSISEAHSFFNLYHKLLHPIRKKPHNAIR